MRVRLIPAVVVALSLFALCAIPALADIIVHQTNLQSDLPGVALHQDPDLVNPWGITHSSGSPFWISDNGKGLSTLYNTAGIKQGLVVTVPPAAPGDTGNPTGVVFNSFGGFNGDIFLFASEDGTISGWRGALGTQAEVLKTGDPANVYKGIAVASVNGRSYIYAANFHTGAIDVFPDAGAPNLTGNFTDPNLPAGYAPFDVQLINGRLYVTYAVQDADKQDDVAGAGNGVVDVFDLNGVLQGRLISNGALNSPWGLTLAPASFGSLAGDLLVGNFGDGRINAYDPLTGAFRGAVLGEDNNPLVIDGLWGLIVGNGGNGGDVNDVYFTAGIPGPDKVEDHGLFGSLGFVSGTAAVPEPATLALFASGLAGVLTRRRKPS